ncbi:hypothetical protein TRIUR3_35390 [Triticum urartu]|uniref:Uncharacterized protein n=1 Tax=Triticum urartu TaxID=4572 RepID=M7Z6Q9_TRIUA|nr:hypothetical protein TRIUR3_35390 [Triticum urartu]
MGRTRPSMEPRRGPHADKSGYPGSQNADTRFILRNCFFHPNFPGGQVVGECHHRLAVYLCHGIVISRVGISVGLGATAATLHPQLVFVQANSQLLSSSYSDTMGTENLKARGEDQEAAGVSLIRDPDAMELLVKARRHARVQRQEGHRGGPSSPVRVAKGSAAADLSPTRWDRTTDGVRQLDASPTPNLRARPSRFLAAAGVELRSDGELAGVALPPHKRHQLAFASATTCKVCGGDGTSIYQDAWRCVGICLEQPGPRMGSDLNISGDD